MATGREYLQSIMSQAAKLQEMTDDELEVASHSLTLADERMEDALTDIQGV